MKEPGLDPRRLELPGCKRRHIDFGETIHEIRAGPGVTGLSKLFMKTSYAFVLLSFFLGPLLVSVNKSSPGRWRDLCSVRLSKRLVRWTISGGLRLA